MIIINGVSAVNGGALTVLIAFIESVKEDAVCFCAVSPSSLPKKNNIRYIWVGHQRGIRRIIWDCLKLNATINSLNIIPDICYSFNNMAPMLRSYPDVGHVIFYHQAIPLSVFNYSLFLKSGFSILFYKNIYPLFVRAYDSRNVKYIVQADWIKSALSCRCNIPMSRISVEKPSLFLPDYLNVDCGWIDAVDYIYPAGDYQYKNHKLILDSIESIAHSDRSVGRDIIIGLTLSEDSWVFHEVCERGLRQYFLFLGLQPRVDILSAFAHGCGLVFPSVVETVGLPLLEALSYKTTIVVADRPFSREVLGNAPECTFVDPDDVEGWAMALSNNIRR